MPRTRPKCYRKLAVGRDRGYTSLVMSFDHRFRVLPSALWLPAICFLAAAQLFLAFAPLMEARFGADARSHVEAAGATAHRSHNADCAACAARGLLAAANHAAQPAIKSLQSVLPGLSDRDERLDFLRESNSRPRAPPLRQA